MTKIDAAFSDCICRCPLGVCPDCLWCPSFEFNDLGPATIFECPDCFCAGSFVRGALDGARAGRGRRRRGSFW
jgi:hypothetical protein